MGRKLDRLVSAVFAEQFHAAGIFDCDEFFTLSPIQIMGICSLSYEDACTLIAETSEKLVKNRARTALDLLSQRDGKSGILPSGLQELDKAMGGGLAEGTIVELCGAPGIGKSQFCLSCCASALLESEACGAGSVVYVDTELKFSAGRLKEILCERSSPQIANDAMERINVKRISNVAQLYETIQDLQSEVILNKVSLVVIDSVAALSRKEGLSDADKDTFIMQQGALLKRLAERCNCVILTTNQVITQDDPPSAKNAECFTSLMVSSVDAGLSSTSGSAAVQKQLCPTLGTGWYHVVTTRILMFARADRKQGMLSGHNDEMCSAGLLQAQRYCSIAKSPMCKLQTIPFSIEANGIMGTEYNIKV